jgi:hypothetical protein
MNSDITSPMKPRSPSFRGSESNLSSLEVVTAPDDMPSELERAVAGRYPQFVSKIRRSREFRGLVAQYQINPIKDNQTRVIVSQGTLAVSKEA